MDTVMHVLGALGIVALVVVTLAVVLVIVVLHKVKKFFVEAAKEVRTSQSSSTPPRIHLVAKPDAEWKDVDQFQENNRKATELGFTDLGTFFVPELPGVMLNALVKPNESAYCVIYEHPKAGSWIDIVTKFADGTRLTANNSPRGGQLDSPPGKIKINDKNADLAGLYAQVVTARGDKALEQLHGTRDEFIAYFEKAYADDMDWRNSRGGATQDEIRRVAAATGREVNDTMVKMAEAIKNTQALDGLVVAFEERLFEKNNYSDIEWEDMRPRLVFIHDRLPLDRVQSLALTHLPPVHIPDSLPNGTSIREYFNKINQGLPADQRLLCIDSLDSPVTTDVYLAPAKCTADSQ